MRRKIGSSAFLVYLFVFLSSVSANIVLDFSFEYVSIILGNYNVQAVQEKFFSINIYIFINSASPPWPVAISGKKVASQRRSTEQISFSRLLSQ